MKENTNTRYVFIITSPDGKSRVLHPFGDSALFARYRKEARSGALSGSDNPSKDIEGRYGTAPTGESFPAIRSHLHREAERGAKKHRSDAEFTLRVVFTSFAFLATYLFLSIVVRDPLPLVDEIIGSVLASVAVYILCDRMAITSRTTVESILRAKTAVDTAVFRPSGIVSTFEQAMCEADIGDPDKAHPYIERWVAAFRESIETAIESGDVADVFALRRSLSDALGYSESRTPRKPEERDISIERSTIEAVDVTRLKPRFMKKASDIPGFVKGSDEWKTASLAFLAFDLACAFSFGDDLELMHE